ncbi:hypothetical protein TREMEDRAFT_66004 [Tremella mesenterica DSM 1558]|uniref:uncharacterized protein n=1 Tax=Tremella mesenterica (strain ATCC 24925 / CBS 8224 / DSM 1558 / NBRC 9311 / NRRL Y-6157 / RJB 2259-6 / UBC 559-6) TaxID=578456 RepID=UPI00032CE7CA|nr:uncharacterized protein TREMEDRAFT_66004 [Tremella mesenterica DSM 1558]EIW65918.1 hypothetical protein TREMEDRAFT_66004 [Tremella mesenterica DSM 1558]
MLTNAFDNPEAVGRGAKLPNRGSVSEAVLESRVAKGGRNLFNREPRTEEPNGRYWVVLLDDRARSERDHTSGIVWVGTRRQKSGIFGMKKRKEKKDKREIRSDLWNMPPRGSVEILGLRAVQ